jgi:Sugar-transfer associated ATP-grasp
MIKKLTAPIAKVRHLLKDLRERGGPIAREHGLSLWGMLGEQLKLARATGIGVNEYFMYRLWRPELAWEEKLAFVSLKNWQDVCDALSPRTYSCLFGNKYITKQILDSAGLPVAKLFGLYDPEFGHAADGAPLKTPEDVARWLESTRPDGFVQKPIEGEKGQAIRAFKRVDDNGSALRYSYPEGGEVDVAEVVRLITERNPLTGHPQMDGGGVYMTSFILEERLQIHADLAPYGPHALPCVRVITILNEDGSVEIPAVMFASQPREQSAHNLGGALCMNVEPETGVLGLGGYIRRGESPHRKSDPDSGLEFFGKTLPHYAEAIALAKRAAKLFPMTRSIGWDIAVTDSGPVIIEGNIRWGIIFKQALSQRGLLRGAMRRACLTSPNAQLRKQAEAVGE